MGLSPLPFIPSCVTPLSKYRLNLPFSTLKPDALRHPNMPLIWMRHFTKIPEPFLLF